MMGRVAYWNKHRCRRRGGGLLAVRGLWCSRAIAVELRSSRPGFSRGAELRAGARRSAADVYALRIINAADHSVPMHEFGAYLSPSRDRRPELLLADPLCPQHGIWFPDATEHS